jgi:hypothetical protein
LVTTGNEEMLPLHRCSSWWPRFGILHPRMDCPLQGSRCELQQ